MKDFRLKIYLPVISELTIEEIRKAPFAVKETFQDLFFEEPEILHITEDVLYQKRQIGQHLFGDGSGE